MCQWVGDGVASHAPRTPSNSSVPIKSQFYAVAAKIEKELSCPFRPSMHVWLTIRIAP